MKKIYLLTVLAVAVGFASCSIEKRHHMNGYYISWNHKTSKADEKTQADVTTNTASAVTAEPVITEPAGAPAVESQASPSVAGIDPAKKSSVKTTAVQAVITNLPAEEVKTAKDKATRIGQRNNAVTGDQPAAPQTDEVLLIILAILLPPLAMYLYEGSWTGRCWLNLVLTLLCGIPGIIHALVVILGGK